jgi:hypothetical protein
MGKQMSHDKNLESAIEYMCRIMCDESQEDSRRDAMAKAVASFLHARMAAVKVKVSDTAADESETRDELFAQIERETEALGFDLVPKPGTVNRFRKKT